MLKGLPFQFRVGHSIAFRFIPLFDELIRGLLTAQNVFDGLGTGRIFSRGAFWWWLFGERFWWHSRSRLLALKIGSEVSVFRWGSVRHGEPVFVMLWALMRSCQNAHRLGGQVHLTQKVGETHDQSQGGTREERAHKPL